MIYLKSYFESRNEIAKSIYSTIIDIVDDFNHENDFQTYITPFEFIDMDSQEIVKRPLNIKKSFKRNNGWIGIVFDLTFNKISREFNDNQRKEFIQKLKDELIHIKEYTDGLGYQNQIQSMGYSDVIPGTRSHTTTYWHQQAWKNTKIDKIDLSEKVRFSIRELNL